MFWPLWKYADYVRTHGRDGDQVFLLGPYSEPIDDENGSILVAYHAMPRWMQQFDVLFDESDVSFRRNLHAYRVACRQYLDEVRTHFKLLKSLLMGKALLTEISRTNKRVRIVPYWNFLKPSADTAPWDGASETTGGADVWIAATAKGTAAWLDGAGRPVIGSGAGTNAEIRYTPRMYHSSAGPERTPDRILFHEFVHASRLMKGVFFRMPAGNGYDDLEEYIAIILSNIYLSEKRQEVFVGNHKGTMILRGADADNFLSNSQHVDTRPTMVIQNFKDSQPEFYRDVVNVPPDRAKYNWVRQYDEEATRLWNQFHKPS
jgi:hypothetical protein